MIMMLRWSSRVAMLLIIMMHLFPSYFDEIMQYKSQGRYLSLIIYTQQMKSFACIIRNALLGVFQVLTLEYF